MAITLKVKNRSRFDFSKPGSDEKDIRRLEVGQELVVGEDLTFDESFELIRRRIVEHPDGLEDADVIARYYPNAGAGAITVTEDDPEGDE